MRALAVVLASILVSGCGVNSYRIPPSELARIAQLPPEARGEHVRVIQELVASDVPAAPPVSDQTEVIIAPRVDVAVGVSGGGGGGHRGYGGGGQFGGAKIGGAGNDGKAAAVAILFLAATALVTAAVVEGSRFDGWARLHPMHPVHLLGRDGGYTVMPLAWIDPGAARWADTAVVRSTEGPWLSLERAPLSREGLTYGMYGGIGSLRSADGTTETGPAWTVQLGVFPTQQIGILASLFFGWRDNQLGATLFETRTTAEVQAMPVQLGILHLGLYGGAGFAHRFEDAIRLPGGGLVAGDETSLALVGGAMLQLDINTRVALTGRLGIARAHDEEMHDVLIGISVY
ncbi:MAG TPA: hypothetical protein VFT22_29320 [Kofleriaceae bacterium]|nr:hypothetical protein [Kofleriaceae bacterium]